MNKKTSDKPIDWSPDELEEYKHGIEALEWRRGRVKALDNERRDALSRGSVAVWPVYFNYDILDNRVCPFHKVVHHYHPMAFPNLPDELANVDEGDTKQLLRFVHRWGLLGQGNAVGTRDEEFFKANHIGGTDPVPWFWGHVRQVRMVVRLLSSLNGEEGVSLVTELERLRSRRFGPVPDNDGKFYGDGTASFLVEGFDSEPRFSLTPFKDWQGDENQRSTAWSIVAWALNKNLSRVTQTVVPEMKGGLVSGADASLQVNSLLEAIYLHLARRVSETAQGRECKQCHKRFQPKHGGQEFCPPAPHTSESSCAQRYRKARYRTRVKRGTE